MCNGRSAYPYILQIEGSLCGTALSGSPGDFKDLGGQLVTRVLKLRASLVQRLASAMRKSRCGRARRGRGHGGVRPGQRRAEVAGRGDAVRLEDS